MMLANHKRTTKGWRWAARALAIGLSTLAMPKASAAFDQVLEFGDNPGDLRMFLQRPGTVRPGLPLVVALHGCTQTASGFDDETGLVALAQETPFLLLLPEQREENMSRRCFRWYDRADNRAGRGESASILAMIDHVIETERTDPDQVFVLGLSAGGAMAGVLMANYPDRFAGGAIMAGLPYGCNRPAGLFDVMWAWLHYNPFMPDGADASYACGIGSLPRTDRDAADWAGFVQDAAETLPERWPLISLWQGAADATVDPANLTELTEQWTAVHGIDAAPDDRQTIGDALREVYRDAHGVPRVETWTLPDFPHAVPIDADGVPAPCGFEADYITDANLCAVRRIAEFWQLR